MHLAPERALLFTAMGVLFIQDVGPSGQPGERLLGFVFQPRIIQRVLGIFPRLAAPAALLALTENEILLIEEGRTNATSYGWFVTFCPRRYVTGVESTPHSEWQNVYV